MLYRIRAVSLLFKISYIKPLVIEFYVNMMKPITFLMPGVI